MQVERVGFAQEVHVGLEGFVGDEVFHHREVRFQEPVAQGVLGRDHLEKRHDPPRGERDPGVLGDGRQARSPARERSGCAPHRCPLRAWASQRARLPRCSSTAAITASVPGGIAPATAPPATMRSPSHPASPTPPARSRAAAAACARRPGGSGGRCGRAARTAAASRPRHRTAPHRGRAPRRHRRRATYASGAGSCACARRGVGRPHRSETRCTLIAPSQRNVVVLLPRVLELLVAQHREAPGRSACASSAA